MTKKYISTWDAMKATASPSEMRELNEIELKPDLLKYSN